MLAFISEYDVQILLVHLAGYLPVTPSPSSRAMFESKEA